MCYPISAYPISEHNHVSRQQLHMLGGICCIYVEREINGRSLCQYAHLGAIQPVQYESLENLLRLTNSFTSTNILQALSINLVNMSQTCIELNCGRIGCFLNKQHSHSTTDW